MLSADHEREEDGTISTFTLTLLRCTAQPSHTQDTAVRGLRLYNWPPLSRYLARYVSRYLDINHSASAAASCQHLNTADLSDHDCSTAAMSYRLILLFTDCLMVKVNTIYPGMKRKIILKWQFKVYTMHNNWKLCKIIN